jgi:hypothetical protein
VVAPVLAAPWSVEAEIGAPDGAQGFISEVMTPFRLHILRTAFYGNIDYGWQSYEKIFSFRKSDGRIVLRKLKPLLQDLTDILVEEKNGAFKGLQQDPDVTLRLQESFLVALDVEGTDWYGQPLMENVRASHDEWNSVNESAGRYDKKLAGSHWVVHYPLGVGELNGATVDNYEIAKSIIANLEASGAIAIPRRLEDTVDDLNKDSPDAWKIEILSDSTSQQSSYVDRMAYLDALKVRGLGLPERSVLEGQSGTKAEAEAHANFAITNMELRHQMCVQAVNWHIVNQLLRLNYGREAENKVYIQPAPITDNALEYLRSLYLKFIEKEQGFFTEFAEVDREALKDRLGVPIEPDENIDADGTTADAEAPRRTEDDAELDEEV